MAVTVNYFFTEYVLQHLKAPAIFREISTICRSVSSYCISIHTITYTFSDVKEKNCSSFHTITHFYIMVGDLTNACVNKTLVPLCLCFKASLSAKLFLWKWLWFAWKWNCMQNSFSYEKLVLKQRHKRTRKWLIALQCKMQINYNLACSHNQPITRK